MFKPGTLIKQAQTVQWLNQTAWGSVIQLVEKPASDDFNLIRGYLGHESTEFYACYMEHGATFEKDDLLLVLGRIAFPDPMSEIVVALHGERLLMIYANRMEAVF